MVKISEERMNLIMVVIALMFLLMASAKAYQIVGNSVVYDSQYANMSVTPATAFSQNGNYAQSFEVCSKALVSGYLFVDYQFPEALQSGWIGLEQNTTINVSSRVWVNNFTNSTGGKQGNYTTIITQQPSKSFVDANAAMTNTFFQGQFNYYNQNGLLFQPNECKRWQVYYAPAANQSTNKWNLRIWGNTINQYNCVLSGTCSFDYLLDPWFNLTTGVYWEDSGQALSGHDSTTQPQGMVVRTNVTGAKLIFVQIGAGSNPTRARVFQPDGLTLYATSDGQVGDNLTFSSQPVLNKSVSYYIMLDASGASYTRGYSVPASPVLPKNNTISQFVMGAYQGTPFTNDTANAYAIKLIALNYSSFTITWNTQSPSNITASNLLTQDMNISYIITSSGNVSNVRMYMNTTHNGGAFSYNYITSQYSYMNFTMASSYNISGTTFYWVFDHDFVYPVRSNYNQTLMEREFKLNQSIGSSNSWVKTRFYNVSPARDFNYMLVDIFNTTGTPLPMFYCNASYSSGNPSTSAQCVNFYTLFPRPKDASFAGENYFIIPMGVINGSINGLYVTNPSYIAFPGGDGWNFKYIVNTTLADSIQTSSNNGNSWGNFAGTTDMHLHQMVNTAVNQSTFSYYVCANDSLTPMTCTAPQVMGFGTLTLPPTGLHVSAPTAGTYQGIISINWTQATSTGSILYYMVNLVDANLSPVLTIGNASLNLTMRWNTTAAANGNYYAVVTAYDNQSLSSSDLSDLFTINNPIPPQPPSTSSSIDRATDRFFFIMLILLGILAYFCSFFVGTIGSMVLKLMSFFMFMSSGAFVPDPKFTYGVIAFSSLVMIHLVVHLALIATGDVDA